MHAFKTKYEITRRGHFKEYVFKQLPNKKESYAIGNQNLKLGADRWLSNNLPKLYDIILNSVCLI